MARRGFFLSLALAVADAAIVSVSSSAQLATAIDTLVSGTTIEFAAGTYELTQPMQIVGKTAWLIGQAGVTIKCTDCPAPFSMLHVSGDGADVTLERITFQGPIIANPNAAASPDSAGGAVYVGGTGAKLTATSCDFNGNLAFEGGAIAVRTDATLVLDACTFTRNVAFGPFGGALHVDDGHFTATGCSFSQNTASTGGGAIMLEHVPAEFSPITLRACTFESNTAAKGGALMVQVVETAMTIDGCAFRSNTATEEGGGMLVAESFNTQYLDVKGGTIFAHNVAVPSGGIGDGGGVMLSQGRARFANVDFVGNKAAASGGAVAFYDPLSPVTFTGCLFETNVAETDGGALAMIGGNQLIVVASSCDFEHNTAGGKGNAVYLNGHTDMEPSALTITSTSFGYNSGASCAVDGSTLSGDPMNVNCGTDESAPAGQAGTTCTDDDLMDWCAPATAFRTQSVATPPTPSGAATTSAGSLIPGMHMDCSMCIRHRCSLWGMNKCAAHPPALVDPQGANVAVCACRCCSQQCGMPRGCDAGMLTRERAPKSEPSGAERGSATALALAAAAVVIVALVAALSAARAARR
ncbi:hypothetical protein KFE25_000726 [Diacronema lutheri]|uniref:Right handed beta helix domain-containing protein n=1 Tax=Diacronema lutheri TaxID=2081491 RepID=A0A8J5XXU1_DIALT|nr:hypothetical protein KFE25_000726 [Diacronema lutheri]|mmetsp:Transcript_4865/g.15063  ORF Transcript_4865/g.15063 Transcript_4865/m.15063 type:complete len:582 (-) Transcript_4865:77-1822(-)